MTDYCINYYVGASCNEPATIGSVVYDACGYPLAYCGSCWNRTKGGD